MEKLKQLKVVCADRYENDAIVLPLYYGYHAHLERFAKFIGCTTCARLGRGCTPPIVNHTHRPPNPRWFKKIRTGDRL